MRENNRFKDGSNKNTPTKYSCFVDNYKEKVPTAMSFVVFYKPARLPYNSFQFLFIFLIITKLDDAAICFIILSKTQSSQSLLEKMKL